MSADKCSVCEDEEVAGICCVPGVPVSMAYGRKCLEANAHPWGVLVANTACVGGFDNSADWWKQMVNDTCKHLGRTLEQFKADVVMALEQQP